jgi:hypothetical protein
MIVAGVGVMVYVVLVVLFVAVTGGPAVILFMLAAAVFVMMVPVILMMPGLVEAFAFVAVGMGQAYDLGRGEHGRYEDRREQAALCADSAFSQGPDHIYPAIR